MRERGPSWNILALGVSVNESVGSMRRVYPLDHAVGFRADQKDQTGQINPHHEYDEAGHRAVELWVASKMAQVEVKHRRSGEHRQHHERGSRSYPVPASLD